MTVAARQGRNGVGCVVIGGKGGQVDAGESGRRRAHQGIGRCKAGERHTKLLLLLLLLMVRSEMEGKRMREGTHMQELLLQLKLLL